MNDNRTDSPPASTARLYAGIGFLLIFNIGLPLLGVPLVASMPLSLNEKTVISGICLAVGELSLPVAIAILGKPGYAWIKSLVFGALKKIAPPSEVGPMRYRIGLFMFIAPLLLAWLEPYVGHHIGVNPENRLTIALFGDALLVASMFVLGGNFWDKVRALFVHDAVVQFRVAAESPAEAH